MTTSAMVLDSPFADFCQLAEELVAKGRERGVVVPTMVTRMALAMLGTSVKQKAGFDIGDLSAIKEVPACRLPALFICARRDDFIGTHHSQSLHDAYGGPKEIVVADGDHNTLRSAKSLVAIGSFLAKALTDEARRADDAAVATFGVLPWSSRRGGADEDQGVGYGPDKVDALGRTIDGALGSTNGEGRREQQWCLDQAHYYCNRGDARRAGTDRTRNSLEIPPRCSGARLRAEIFDVWGHLGSTRRFSTLGSRLHAEIFDVWVPAQATRWRNRAKSTPRSGPTEPPSRTTARTRTRTTI